MNKKKQKSLFERIVDFINQYGYFTRKALLNEFPENKTVTIDCYRNYFRAAGFLETSLAGKYRRIKKIPKDITELELKKICYNYPSLYRKYKKVYE
jgi:hypothetical protein